MNGYNLYAYCFNNPIALIDSSGNWPTWNDFETWFDGVAQSFVDNIATPISNFANDICEDITNYDKDNNDPEKVLDANYFSSYGGAFVIKHSFGNGSMSFGILFISSSVTNTDIVKHEWGHYEQLKVMGPLSYTIDVALPSVTEYWLYKTDKLPYDYDGSWWEHDANQRGGVPFDYTLWKGGAPTNFFELIPLFFK